MTNSIHIVRADPGDAELISDLSVTTFVETFSGTCSDEDMLQFVDTCFSKEIILGELQDREDFYFLAFIDGSPAGYMRLKEDYTDYPAMKRYNALELKRIYVLKEYQSKKIGAALMSFAIEFATTKHYEAVWLGVWEENVQAISFYEKWGFEDTGFTHQFYIGNTGQTDHWFIKFM